MPPSEAANELRSLLLRSAPQAREIAAMLDGLTLADAVAAVRGLHGRRLQRALWNAVAANPRISVDDLVAREHAPMKPVVFHGKNSLPAFTEFEKICCRPPSGTPGNVLWGYNETRIRPLIGPGYYVVHDTAGDPLGGVAFDYRRLPDDHPAGWPPIRPNSAGISRFIYNNTVDYTRRVSARVFIGAATRHGRALHSYFVLVREAD